MEPPGVARNLVERGPELALVVESPFSFLQIFCSLAIRREARAFSVGVCLGWSCTSVLALPPGMYRGRKRFQHQRPRSNMPFMMQMKQKSHPTRTAISGHDHSSKGAIAPSFAMFELKWAAHCLVLCPHVRPSHPVHDWRWGGEAFCHCQRHGAVAADEHPGSSSGLPPSLPRRIHSTALQSTWRPSR